MKRNWIIIVLNVFVLLLIAFLALDLHLQSQNEVLNHFNEGEVTAFITKSIKQHLILLSVVVIAIIGSSVVFNRNYQRRVKAEEEARHWREKRELEEKALQSEVRYRTIVETAHDIIWTLDTEGNFVSLNKSGEDISGYKISELYGKSFAPLVHPADLRACHDLFKKTLQGNQTSMEVRVYAKDGQLFILSVNAAPLFENGQIIGVVGFGRDITERKKAEEALLKNEEKYRKLVETMNEGLIMIDENSLWTYVNDKFCYMLGCFPGEFIGRTILEFLDETDQKIIEEQLARCRKGEYPPYEIEWAKKDGTNVTTIVSPRPIFGPNGKFKGGFAIITDITERKRAEEALRESEKQLRHLSSQLLTIQEQERKRISGELHDELGQVLALMKLRVKFIEKGLRKDQTTIREECDHLVQSVDQAIENVRRLSRDLSPSILEDLGFSASLRWMIKEFTKHHNIEVSLNTIDVDHLFSRKAQINLYRIFQEALTNIGKHAQATRISITIRNERDRVSFSVNDDGKGFDVKRATMKKGTEKGLGLATMNERAWMLGGFLDLWSQEGKGTKITFTVPTESRQE